MPGAHTARTQQRRGLPVSQTWPGGHVPQEMDTPHNEAVPHSCPSAHWGGAHAVHWLLVQRSPFGQAGHPVRPQAG